MNEPEVQVFHFPALEGKRLTEFYVSEPGGYIQMIFEDDLQVQICATLVTTHPSLRHGAGQILVTAEPQIFTFKGGATANLREPAP